MTDHLTHGRRTERLQVLYDHYDNDTHDDMRSTFPKASEARGVERYVTVQRRGDGDYFLNDFATEEHAFAQLGDAVLEGDEIEAVYDLDTGEMIQLHVATPVVSRSCDQGTMENPLKPERSVFGLELGNSTERAIGVLTFSRSTMSVSGNVIIEAGYALPDGSWTKTLHIVMTPDEAKEFFERGLGIYAQAEARAKEYAIETAPENRPED